MHRLLAQLWIAGTGEPMPWNIVPEVCDVLRGIGVNVANRVGAPAPSAAATPSAAPASEPQQSNVHSAVSSVVGSAVGDVVSATAGSRADDRV